MANDPTKDLTEKQKLFGKEYLVDLNATQAAIRAGYSEKTAAEIGWENLRKPNLQAYIQKLMDKRSKKVEITAENVLAEIGKMAFANMTDYITIDAQGDAYVDLSELTDDQAAAIQEVNVDSYFDKELGRKVKKVKLKLSDKRGNLDLLGRHLKLFNDKLELTGDLIIEYGHRKKPEQQD